ncbi:hypothetical protein V8E54_000112 [Elaphomyces granulatus]
MLAVGFADKDTRRHGGQITHQHSTVNNLGLLYKSQGKLDEAEKMYRRALQGYEKAFGSCYYIAELSQTE